MDRKFFKFMNEEEISYVVLRGFDIESEKIGKDLDILILKKDYDKFKDKFPKTKRVIDFYIDKEDKKGIIIVPKSALDRRIFDEEKGFFVLDKKDLRRMNFFRKKIHGIRKIKTKLNIYDYGKISRSKIIFRNLKMFGLRYIILDIFYQSFRFIYNKTSKEKLNKKEIIKKKVNDYEMFIDKNGKGIHRDLFLKGTREEISVGIVKNLLKKGDVVLEAGANIGYYCILESKLIGDRGLIYAVEPIKENFELLKRNIALNKLKNIKTFNLGFSNKQGELNINVSSEGNLNTPRDIDKGSKVETVKCNTMDGFLKGKKKPNFMRIDIEGYEDVVFNGGEKTLNNLSGIFVELHFPLIEKQKMISLLKTFEKKGFEIHKAIMEWERLEDESSWLGKVVNYFYKKRSRPIVYDKMRIHHLMGSKNFLDGHLSLEVFFVKK